MNRWAVILGCVLGLLGAGCADDDSDGSGGAAGSGAGVGASTGGAGASGGTNAGTGGSSAGTSGSAGAAGTGSTGTGGSGASGTGGTGGAGGTSGAGGSGTGGAAGVSGASGASGAGSGGSSGTSGAPCGGRGLAECEAGWVCHFPPEADCGRSDAPGACRELNDLGCLEIYRPVCGCDGHTYSSDCHAHHAGMSIDYEGECGAEPPTGGRTCVPPSGVACLIAPVECPGGQVPAYDNDPCGGECVAIEQCACAGPEDCPFPDWYTCHLSAAHCGPFVN